MTAGPPAHPGCAGGRWFAIPAADPWVQCPRIRDAVALQAGRHIHGKVIVEL
ncbi:hypothetical protein [Raineyella sp. W15-4]|uniref:hypothetical protein n=1 Tax=Raineyella sp. W15-4 TaxID=3081651 RepID=UPI002953DF55|nr:hypothetical protein [Raineyella sp. W15-4]WOQ16159.1 hypothetical protein R0145_13215 [Raineyella sp. W15-4]